MTSRNERQRDQRNGYMCCTPFRKINQSTALNQAYSIYTVLCAFIQQIMNLQLSLKKQWFEMTKSGIKTEDYREINYYWFKRLVENADGLFKGLIGLDPKEVNLEKRNKYVEDIATSKYFRLIRFKEFNKNIMTLGYPKSTDSERILKLEHKGIEVRTGNSEWGAIPDKLYFVIKHGSIS